MDAVRMADGDDAVIEGWAVPFAGSFNDDRDSYGTRFSARTDFRLDWYPQRPLLYHHGLDKDIGLDPVGTVRAMEVRDQGVWMQAQLDKQSQYFGAIRDLVKAGKLYLSSGSVEHLVGINQRTGHVDRWPIVEQTLTTTPSNLLADIPVHSFRAAVGGQVPDELEDGQTIIHDALRAVWTQKFIDSLPNSSFAYVEPGTDKSKRHLPYKGSDGKPDAAHTRNALARLDQTDIPAAAKASAKRKLLAAAKTLGIDTADSARAADPDTLIVNGARYIRAADDTSDAGETRAGISTVERSYEDIRGDIADALNPMQPYSYDGPGLWYCVLATYDDHVIVSCSSRDEDEDDRYWDIPYTLGDDQEPVLAPMAEWTEVEAAYLPVTRAATSSAPLILEANHLNRRAAAFVEYTEGLDARRYREGRMLSAGNMQTISEVADGLDAHAKALRDLHQRAMAKQEEAARAALFADPELRRGYIEMLDLAPI